MKVGIRQVATRAGVSTATVARVLHDTGQVSQELTARVKQAIAELDYVPNAVASSLSSGRTGVIGLLVPDIANPFFGEVARGLEDYASQHNNHVLVCSSDLAPERELSLARAFEARMVDAVACTPSGADSSHLRRLQAGGQPLIFIDRSVPGIQAPTVGIDNAAAAERATRYLLELGHRRIAMLCGPEVFASSRNRLQGFRRAMKAAKAVIHSDYVQQGFLGITGGTQAMRRVLRLSPRPTAVLSFNNFLAVGALRALREEAVRVPDDLSFLTFDDMSLFPYVDPPITVIAQPAYQIGSEAGRVLFELLNHPEKRQADVILPTELVIRSSCSSPRYV